MSLNDIEKISGVVPDKVISQIYDKVKGSNGYSDIQELAQSLILDGYDVQQLIARILAFFIEAGAVTDLQKAKISEVVAETDFKMIQGGDEELNLLHTLSSVATIVN